MSNRCPNLLFVFADQWRAQSVGYMGNADVRTPNIDSLEGKSVNFVNAVSGCPVCSPYRASLLTGQYPLTHGVFINDTSLDPDAVSIGKCLREAGYATAYIGKWHVDGHGRRSFIPPERRQGFDYWRVCECTHQYNDSIYYGDTDEPLHWEGYDAIAQTKDAVRYLREERDGEQPFALFLSWGPPHSPYDTAPERYRAMYDPATLSLRANVPPEHAVNARQVLAGYYAHVSVLDDCVGMLLDALREQSLDRDTIVVLTSDHGDMLGTTGVWDKQRPFEESIRVPFLLRWSAGLGTTPRQITTPIDAPDIMPTLLSLCGLSVPDTVEGQDFAPLLRGEPCELDSAALLCCPCPFGNWHRGVGGREYRGVRTERYTFVRGLDGPWLLFDNAEDPCQLHNLVGRAEYRGLQDSLEAILDAKLRQRNDLFLPGDRICEQFGYVTNERGIVVERLKSGRS